MLRSKMKKMRTVKLFKKEGGSKPLKFRNREARDRHLREFQKYFRFEVKAIDTKNGFYLDILPVLRRN